MATWKIVAMKLGLMDAVSNERTFLESGLGLCKVCGSLKFNPQCTECQSTRWQSLLMGLNAEDTADVKG